MRFFRFSRIRFAICVLYFLNTRRKIAHRKSITTTKLNMLRLCLKQTKHVDSSFFGFLRLIFRYERMFALQQYCCAHVYVCVCMANGGVCVCTLAYPILNAYGIWNMGPILHHCVCAFDAIVAIDFDMKLCALCVCIGLRSKEYVNKRIGWSLSRWRRIPFYSRSCRTCRFDDFIPNLIVRSRTPLLSFSFPLCEVIRLPCIYNVYAILLLQLHYLRNSNALGKSSSWLFGCT